MELYKPETSTEVFELNDVKYKFYVREPNTEDKVSYLALAAVKINGKIKSGTEHLLSSKFKIGCNLITGFPDKLDNGDYQFEYQGKHISSDDKSENFNPDWKNLILPNFLNNIVILATKKCEGITQDELVKRGNNLLKLIEAKEMEDDIPLESNSLQQ